MSKRMLAGLVAGAMLSATPAAAVAAPAARKHHRHHHCKRHVRAAPSAPGTTSIDPAPGFTDTGTIVSAG